MIRKDTCTPMFNAALFTIAKTWKQPKCPSTEEWLKKMQYIHTIETWLLAAPETHSSQFHHQGETECTVSAPLIKLPGRNSEWPTLIYMWHLHCMPQAPLPCWLPGTSTCIMGGGILEGPSKEALTTWFKWEAALPPDKGKGVHRIRE